METKIIDGKAISAIIKEEVKADALELQQQGIFPQLAVVLVGDDPASATYVRNKEKACAAVGIVSKVYWYPSSLTEEELLSCVGTLNEDPAVHGILVQSPLPEHIDETKVVFAIDPKKDVDCFHPINVGLLHTGGQSFLPCTPAGILELLKRSNISVLGKRCVVIGRSNIVGKPVAMLLMGENVTVTICHSKTENLGDICLEGDIIVVATGNKNTLTGDMVKEGAVVIDVGMHRDEAGKYSGDVDFASVAPKCSAITPVPGGVGPMTVAMLLKNCIIGAKIQAGLPISK